MLVTWLNSWLINRFQLSVLTNECYNVRIKVLLLMYVDYSHQMFLKHWRAHWFTSSSFVPMREIETSSFKFRSLQFWSIQLWKSVKFIAWVLWNYSVGGQFKKFWWTFIVTRNDGKFWNGFLQLFIYFCISKFTKSIFLFYSCHGSILTSHARPVAADRPTSICLQWRHVAVIGQWQW